MTTITRPKASGRAPAVRRLPTPARSRLIDTDLVAVVTAYLLCITGMWVRHGGWAELTEGWTTAWASLSRLTGLITSGLAIIGVILTGRPKSLERLFGMDRLFLWHRVIGDTVGILLVAHVATGSTDWIIHSGLRQTISDFIGGEPYMGLATIGGAITGLVILSSLRSFRKRLSYETWYFVHLSVYVGFGLSYGHQIVLGTDLAEDRVARVFWAALHIGAVACVLWGRWGCLARAWVRPLRVEHAVAVAPGVVSLHLSGPPLHKMRAAAGQFFFLRPLRRGMWWKSHPFSLSATPTTAGLRFTIKSLGDGSSAVMALPHGTKVVVEGPYGATTSAALGDRKGVFVVGGVGVTPVRAMLEDLPAGSEPLVLYRARRTADLVHLDEMQDLARRTGGQVLTLVGPTAALADRDPFSPSRLRAMVPDLADRVAVLCGPERLVHAARAAGCWPPRSRPSRFTTNGCGGDVRSSSGVLRSPPTSRRAVDRRGRRFPRRDASHPRTAEPGHRPVGSGISGPTRRRSECRRGPLADDGPASSGDLGKSLGPASSGARSDDPTGDRQ